MLKTGAATKFEARLWSEDSDHAAYATHTEVAGRASQRIHSRCIEAELPDSITARRNVLMALWAGRLRGLSGEELTAYASDMRFVSQCDGAIIGMIADDLTREGVSLSFEDIQQALSRCHRVALRQACATD